MSTDFFPKTDLSNLKQILDEFGVAVLTDVFPIEECDTIRAKVFSYLKTEHNVVDPDDFEKLKIVNGGMIHKYGIHLLPQILDLKCDERTMEPFKVIWNESKLTTSLDGIFIGPPPELVTNRDYFYSENRFSFHADQASNKRELCCVQSFINLENTEHGDGCLSVLTKSHLYFNEFIDHFKIDTHGNDWMVLNKTTHLDWYRKRGCEWKTIMAPKGSMVIWDSRTIHSGTLPRKDRPSPNWRFLVYVCYTPASLQTHKDAKLKKQAYIENGCTPHWPYGVRVFPSAYDDSKVNDLKNLTERQKKCLGIWFEN